MACDDYTCAMCGYRYSAEQSEQSCARCSLVGAGGCHKVRCPRCGYEMPPPARLPRLLAKLLTRKE